MSDETTFDPNHSEASNSSINEAVDNATHFVIDRCMEIIDTVCREGQFDSTAMIYMSVNVSSHLMARGLFCANGPDARTMMKHKMIENVSEILESAVRHIDQSERELNSGIIRPN